MHRSLIRRLKELFGADNVLTGRIDLEAYAYDSSPFQALPEAVVLADSAEQISGLMRLAAQEGIVVIPRGAGTNLSGGCIPVCGGIILAMNRLNRILDIDAINQQALVEPGVTNLALQQAAAVHGLMFAPDPASLRVATIGGNVAEGAGGMRGVKYGVTRDHLLGAEVILADGSRTFLGMQGRFHPGVNLTGIFCGSEGTLGIMTKILVKLTPISESVRTLTALFDDLLKAGQAVASIVRQGIIPTTMEIMDQAMVRAVDDFLHLGLPRDVQALLLLEIDGVDEELDRQAEEIRTVCLAEGATRLTIAASEEERQSLWKARRSGNGALGRIRPAYMVQDVTVPRQKLPEMLRFVEEVARKHNIVIAQLAHAGDGNLHPHLLYDPEIKEEEARVHEAAKEIFLAALEVGGTLTGEHGIGLEKKQFMPFAFSPDDLAFMADIKRALDPRLILNRGKILDLETDL